jgi:hypothetical protein
MPVLLRLDAVQEEDDPSFALRIFSQDAVESSSVSCALDGSCADVLMVATGNREALRRVYANFSYTHSLRYESKARSISGVVGELYLRKGYNYWLTATHLCYHKPVSGVQGGRLGVQGDRLGVSVSESGSLFLKAAQLKGHKILGSSPAVLNSLSDECDAESNITLFPNDASVETSWLSISDSGIYNSEPNEVDARRSIAESGVACASNISALQRDLTLYKLDCTVYGACKEYKSIPFRRVAKASLFISLAADVDQWISVAADETLSSLPRLADSTDAFIYSLLKMAMVTLAAAVVFVRAKRKTASSSWLIKTCVSTAAGFEGHGLSEEYDSTSEDRVIGFLAFAARGTLVVSRSFVMTQDRQLRVVTAELVATLMSAVHWTLRYTALGFDEDELPVSKLGGSTAIIDSTAAVMVAFSEPPTLAASASKFDPTARMLVALLVATVVVSRCAFSASCCGMLWSHFVSIKGRRDYAIILLYSSVAWCMQSAILGVTLCDLFATPAAYSMSRSVSGEPLQLRLALFLAVVCAGLPRLMTTCMNILSKKDHTD